MTGFGRRVRLMVRQMRNLAATPVAILASTVAFIVRHPSNRGHRTRALLRAASGLVTFRLTGVPVTARLGRDSVILTRPHVMNFGTAVPLYANPPDHDAARLLQSVLRPGDLFVDVGANIGIYTILAAEVGARVVAVEPASDTADLLERNVRLNRLEDRVRIERVAVGARSGTARFTRGTDVLNRIVDDPASPAADEGAAAQQFWTLRAQGFESVPVRTLVDLVGDEFVAAVKIDVEGQELHVLEGADDLLRSHRVGYLQIENNAMSMVHYRQSNDAVWSTLRKYDYALFGFGRDGGLRAEGPEPTSPDVIAVAPNNLVWRRLGKA
jgi:FkbM family methyltransferase